VQVQGLNNVVAIAAGRSHTAALRGDGTVWAWGSNTRGQLGDGTTTTRSTPVQVQGLSNVVAITAGFSILSSHTVALRSDGTVWAWGPNGAGELGVGSTTDHWRPVQVQGLSNVVEISAGNSHTVALRSDGTVWTWGRNWNGGLGDGTTTDRHTPVPVQGGLSNVVAISAGNGNTVALRSDGTVWAWGMNVFNKLGVGTPSDQHTPAQVQHLNNVVAIAAGDTHTVAVRYDGTVWAWGRNTDGRLGDGTTTNRHIPTQVRGANGEGFLNLLMLTITPMALAGGFGHTLALRKDGTVWDWGNSSSGKQLTPVQVQNLNNIASIAAGDGHNIALRNDGTVWAWGSNTHGQLGDGTTTSRPTPIQVQNLSNIIAIATGSQHSIALRNDGTVWTWGRNCNGQLGNNSTANRLTPVQVKLNNVIAITAGRHESDISAHTIALRDNGTVWAWGLNNSGQLGDGSTTNRLTPVQVKNLNSITAITAGGRHSIALRNDGTVWAWGLNGRGQLGNIGLTVLTPIQVPSVSNVIAISASNQQTTALRDDGTVWRWGIIWDTWGYYTSHTPLQVQNLNNIIAIATSGPHTVAVRNNGRVLAWGTNQSGQLGDGTTTDRGTPNYVLGPGGVGFFNLQH